jgi:hypothetical protein
MSRSLPDLRAAGRTLGFTLGVLLIGSALLIPLSRRPHALPDDSREVTLRPFDAPEVLDTRDALLMATKSEHASPAPRSAPAAGESRSGQAVAERPADTAPPAEVGPAYDALEIIDPRRNVEATPVALTELPSLESAPAGGGDDVPLYTPGSIGKAKRQWAAAAAPEEEPGRFRGLVVGGGGHCPMPGKGGARGWPGVLWRTD